MEFFNRAKVVRLKSQHNRYLIADDDEESVRQSNDGSSRNARWTVELVDGKNNRIRLKSCHWNYLAASNEAFLLGLTGKKVILASPRLRSEPSVEWEPIKEGTHLKLRTKKGKFLRANGGMPPYRSSVTHDLPKRTATQDWVLWKLDVLDIDHSEMGPEEDNTVAVEEEEERRSSVSSSVVDSGYDVGSPGSFRSGHSFKQATETFSRTSSSSSQQCTSPAASSHNNAHPSHRTGRDTKSRLSNSFNHLKSVVSEAEKLLDKESEHNSSADALNCESPSSHPFEVRMAKQILEDVADMDFESLLSSGRLKRVEKAIFILSNEEDNLLSPDRLQLKDRFLSLKSDHKSATNDLTEYATFSSKRSQMKREFQKDLAKAQELEAVENDCSDKLARALRRREELLKELGEIAEQIRDAEETQAKNGAAIDELIVEISQKSENLKVMEKEDKLWQSKKDEAERTLKEIEDDWVKMKNICHGT